MTKIETELYRTLDRMKYQLDQEEGRHFKTKLALEQANRRNNELSIELTNLKKKFAKITDLIGE